MNASDSDELADRSERGTNRVMSAGYATAADLAANVAPETFVGLTAPEGVSQDEWDQAIKLALLQPPRPVSIVAWLDSFEARLAALEGGKLAAVDEVTATENDAATIEQWKARALAAEGKLAEAEKLLSKASAFLFGGRFLARSTGCIEWHVLDLECRENVANNCSREDAIAIAIDRAKVAKVLP